MFTVEPPFKILRYENNNTAFGGVEMSFGEPYEIRDLTHELGCVIENIGDFLKRAYRVRTFVENPQIDFLSTRVVPVEAILEKREVDIDLGYHSRSEFLGKLRTVCRRMSLERKDNAIVTKYDNRGLYFFHTLKENFDPVSTGDLLKATKSVLLDMAGQKLHTVKTEITPEFLEVDAEIKVDQKYIV
jgi:hypothetical protein